MYLCKFGQNTSTSSEDNAQKPYLIASPADSLCKQFGPQSDRIKCLASSGSKLVYTDGIPERIFRKR